MISKGIKGNAEMTVTEQFSAKTLGSGTMDVLGTPGLAALAEKCAWESVAPFLEEGQGTVGIRMDLKHLSATPVGKNVWCESELTEIADRRLLFKFRAFDDAGIIGEGCHERFIVTKEKFLEKTHDKYAKA